MRTANMGEYYINDTSVCIRQYIILVNLILKVQHNTTIQHINNSVHNSKLLTGAIIFSFFSFLLYF